MPELPLDGTVNTPPGDDPNIRPSQKRALVCEFCQCHLAPNGDVLKRGENATLYMKQADQIEELIAARDKALADDAAVREELTQLRAQLGEKKKSGFWQ